MVFSMEFKMKKFLLLISILFLFLNAVLASDGAAGSGKPVAIKMRKDYLENIIKQEIQNTFKDNITIDDYVIKIKDENKKEIGNLTITLNLNIKISDVLFSRGLLDEEASPFGTETASQYRVILFGSLSVSSVKSLTLTCNKQSDLCKQNHVFSETEKESMAKYFNKILDSYRYDITDSEMESVQYNDHKIKTYPNFMLKGYFMPKEGDNGQLNESIYFFEFEDFNMHDWLTENNKNKENQSLSKIIEDILRKSAKIEINISSLNALLKDRNPFLKISKPGKFETESTMIAMDYCDEENPNDCITYSVPEPPENSFSDNKAGNLMEFRISEDVIHKEVMKNLYTSLEEKEVDFVFELDLDYGYVNVFNDYLYISFETSMSTVPLLTYCSSEFEYYYKFFPSTEKFDENKIKLIVSDSKKNTNSSNNLIYYLLCKHAFSGEINNTFKNISTELINENFQEQKLNLKKIALNDINLEDINLKGLDLGGKKPKSLNDVVDYIMDSKEMSFEKALKHISKYTNLQDILDSYKIKASFDTGKNYGDVVFSVSKKAPEKDSYLANFNWAYSDSNKNDILNFADSCWYSASKEECDLDGDGIQDHVDDKVFKAESEIEYSAEDGALYGEKTCKTIKTGLFYTTICGQDKEVHYGEYFDVDGTLYMKELNNNPPKTNLSSYYCYCGDSERIHGQCDVTSTCGEHHGNPREVINKEFGKNTWQPMYNTNIASRNNKLYKKGVSDKKINNNTGIYATKTSGKWDWQKDLEDVYGISDLQEWDVQNIIQCKEGVVVNEKECHMKHYQDFNAARVSFAPSRSDSNNNYVLASAINPEYFENYFVVDNNILNFLFSNATKHRWASSQPSYFPLIKWKDLVTEYEYSMAGDWLYYPYERFNDFLNPWFIDLTGPVENPGMPMPEASWYVYDMLLTPDALFLERVEHGANTQQVFTFDNSYMYYSLENGNFFITQSLYAVSQKDKKEVVNGISLNAGSFVSYNGAIFAAGNLVQNNIMSQRTQENSSLLNDDHIYDNVFVKISENAENYELERLADIPGLHSLTLKLFISDSKLNVAAFNTSGELKFSTYNLEDSSWSEIGSFDFGTDKAPLISSLTTVEKKVFFATLEPDGTFLYEFNAESGIKKVIQISEERIPFTKIAAFKDEVVIADLRKIKEGSVGIYSLKDGKLNFRDTELKMINFTLPNYDGIEKLCVYEKEGLILPGITNRFNKCNLSNNYNYKSKLFFDYKYSLAGYENSLYLGGLTGIRRMEIGENGKLTKKEMLYSGKTKSLAVYQDVLYAANNDEIDLFSISEDGKISRISGLKAADCENLKTENGKLFTAENKQVRIFSLSDPSNPELLQTITVEGGVKDIEILNNQLFVYEETGSCFSRKGTVRIYDISDLNNITQTQNFETTCKKAEFQKSGSKVYLGCKTETFKIEESGLTKMHGSPKYLRDGYVFDGILYQVFSGTLHKSSVTKNTQPDNDGWF